MEFTARYGHVQIETAEERARSCFSDWAIGVGHLAKVLEISAHHFLGDQTALEALVRFSDEELKHQELFRRIEAKIAAEMPDGYAFVPQANEVAADVLGKSTWSVLARVSPSAWMNTRHWRPKRLNWLTYSPPRYACIVW